MKGGMANFEYDQLPEQDKEDLKKFMTLVKEDDEAGKKFFVQIYEEGRLDFLSHLWISFLEDKSHRQIIFAWQGDKEFAKVLRGIFCR